MPRPLRALSALLLALVPLRGAEAQSVSLTLSHDAALWNDVVVARLEADSCGLAAASPEVGFTPGVGWTIDIDATVKVCNVIPNRFTESVEIGPLYPQDYVVRVFENLIVNDQPTAPTLAATAPLKVYQEASVSIEAPGSVSDAAPFPLVLRGPASGGCFLLDPPTVQGNVITANFDDNCPVIPIPGSHLFEEEAMIGPLAAGEYELRFFEWSLNPLEQRPRLHRQTLTVHDADKCVPSDTVLCLQDGRFRVEVHWRILQENGGVGHAIPLAGRDDSGLFWFFQKENIELTVKVLNGCALGGHWWVFLSSGSTVEYGVIVTDTLTHRTKTYGNVSEEAAPLVADTAAFPCDAP